MVCKVKLNRQPEFGAAQERWQKISNAEGFIAQTGGWNLNDNLEACIISFWQSQSHLTNFMHRLHDEIFENNQQLETYNSLTVSHFDCQLDMPGEQETLLEAIKWGKVLRIADCNVRPGRIGHFGEAQQKTWVPGMQHAKGMLGGKFSKVSNGDSRYLVSTFWDSLENHNIYQKHQVPGFRKQTDVSKDLVQISGKAISLVDSWKVLHSGRL